LNLLTGNLTSAPREYVYFPEYRNRQNPWSKLVLESNGVLADKLGV
jgi:hypothetical protein